MRILVENSGYTLINHGDTAMLQVALLRLRNLWPDATIEVVNSAPHRLRKYCPDAVPIYIHPPRAWYKESIRLRFNTLLPSVVSSMLTKFDDQLWKHAPLLSTSLLRINARLHGTTLARLREFDLVVATGGGYIVDNFPIFALIILDTLEMAARLGKPVAILGHGIGPLDNPILRARAKKVLPMLDLITIREKHTGLSLLQHLGVHKDNIITTGDDAISLAYDVRKTTIGDAIGINIRVATYSDVNSSLANQIANVLSAVEKKYNTTLLPVPITLQGAEGKYKSQDDVHVLQNILSNSNQPINTESFESPSTVIEQIGRCRIVVTGSYHAAVFALSQGIPAVCLTKSAYYMGKFQGLADQFGLGCEIVLLDDDNIEDKLLFSIDRAWNMDNKIRIELTHAAKKQIELGISGYNRLFEITQKKKPFERNT